MLDHISNWCCILVKSDMLIDMEYVILVDVVVDLMCIWEWLNMSITLFPMIVNEMRKNVKK